MQGVGADPAYTDWRLFIPGGTCFAVFECAWQLETDDIPPTAVYCLAKVVPIIPPTPHEYRWQVNWTPGAPTMPVQWGKTITWSEDDWPEPATTAADCHKGRVLTEASGTRTFEIEPVPVYICTQEELEAFLETE